MSVSKSVLALALVSFPTPLIASLNIILDQSRNSIMPADSSFKEGEIVTAKKGEIFYRQGLGRAYAAILDADVTFTFLGETISISKNQQLILSQATGDSANQFRATDVLYCTAPKRTGKKRIVGMSEIAAVGMDLDALAKLRHIQTQSCLIDSGGDGTAERAMVVDTSNRELIVPVAITPATLQRPGLIPMPGESEARMVFNGGAGIMGNISASFQVVEEGNLLAFDNGQTIFNGSSLPHTIIAWGGSFTILSYDRKTKSAQIRIDRPFSPSKYGVKTVFTRR